MEKVQNTWGSLGSRLSADAIKAVANTELTAYQEMETALVAGKTVSHNPRLDEVRAMIKVWNAVIADPVGFNRDKVRKTLAALPTLIGKRNVLVDLVVAHHFDVTYTWRDYSDILPKKLNEKTLLLPVRVVRLNDRDKWRDVVQATIDKVDFSNVDRKKGCYTRCVGIAVTIGGTVDPCPRNDEVRITDQPRLRCDACTKEFNALRNKARRGGVVSSPAGERNLDDVLARLSK